MCDEQMTNSLESGVGNESDDPRDPWWFWWFSLLGDYFSAEGGIPLSAKRNWVNCRPAFRVFHGGIGLLDSADRALGAVQAPFFWVALENGIVIADSDCGPYCDQVPRRADLEFARVLKITRQKPAALKMLN